jgi:hypothetical protein
LYCWKIGITHIVSVKDWYYQYFPLSAILIITYLWERISQDHFSCYNFSCVTNFSFTRPFSWLWFLMSNQCQFHKTILMCNKCQHFHVWWQWKITSFLMHREKIWDIRIVLLPWQRSKYLMNLYEIWYYFSPNYYVRFMSEMHLSHIHDTHVHEYISFASCTILSEF